MTIENEAIKQLEKMGYEVERELKYDIWNEDGTLACWFTNEGETYRFYNGTSERVLNSPNEKEIHDTILELIK